MPIDSALTRYSYLSPSSEPMFSVANENGLQVSATSKASFNSVLVNPENAWSTSLNRFVVPATGLYEFNVSLLSASPDNTGFYYEFRKNGSAMTLGTYPRGYTRMQYTANTASGVMQLLSSDYIEVWITGGTMHSYHCFFSCKKVG